eukprot:c17241_g1_i1.p1 GENE.c17241_g1_i1~~c17241_g1_i1.p1  ORF type:complete len:357 (+),score=-9.91 c17241_g1_i1:97-1071(+)
MSTIPAKCPLIENRVLMVIPNSHFPKTIIPPVVTAAYDALLKYLKFWRQQGKNWQDAGIKYSEELLQKSTEKFLEALFRLFQLSELEVKYSKSSQKLFAPFYNFYSSRVRKGKQEELDKTFYTGYSDLLFNKKGFYPFACIELKVDLIGRDQLNQLICQLFALYRVISSNPQCNNGRVFGVLSNGFHFLRVSLLWENGNVYAIHIDNQVGEGIQYFWDMFSVICAASGAMILPDSVDNNNSGSGSGGGRKDEDEDGDGDGGDKGNMEKPPVASMSPIKRNTRSQSSSTQGARKLNFMLDVNETIGVKNMNKLEKVKQWLTTLIN